ncbi:MAG: response regulator [Desulfobacterales bacterium]|nr:response regulator [Desulfobacterales bacterium]
MEEFRVLVVDDEDDFRETFVNRLQRRNLDVDGVESGEKALEWLDKHLYDVCILDVKMPGMDGVETLREMKTKRPLMEVIMLTGHASVESGIEGMKLGAFDYIMKPADIDELMEKMRQAHEKKTLHEEKIRQAKIKELEGHPARVFEQIREEGT